MKTNIKKCILIWTVFLTAFLFRVILNAQFQGLESPPDPDMGPDHVEYDLLARSLLSGNGYALHANSPPTAFRAPGVPVLLAGIYKISHGQYIVARLAFSFLGAITCVLLYYLLRFFVTSTWAYVGAFLLALYPGHAYYSMHFFSEVPWALFLTGVVFCLLHFRKTNRVWAYTGYILCLAMGVYTRPIAILFPLVLFALIAIHQINSERKNSKELVGKLVRESLIPLAGVVLLLIPWAERNHEKLGFRVWFTTNGGSTFYGANNSVVSEDAFFRGNWISPENLPQNEWILEASGEYQRDKRCYEAGLNFISDNKKEMPTLLFAKLWRFISPFLHTPNATFNFVVGIGWACLSIPAVLGLYISFKLTFQNPIDTVHAVLLMMILNTIVFYGSQRFRASIMPFLVIYAVLGASYLFDRYRTNFPNIQ